MEMQPNLPLYFTGVKGAIENHGDDIWEVICATAPAHKPFRLRDVYPAVGADLGLSDSTARQYTRAVLNNVRLERDGNGAVQKRGLLWHWND